jgi:alginate O-acetyltransferase complex protein AlgI
MLFNSLPFLYGFLPVTYIVFWLLKSKTQRYAWLALTGYGFYAGWNYKFCALMAFSTVVAYLAGLGMLRWQEPSWKRRLCLVVPVTSDLALLGFFKYANFTLATAAQLGAWLGSPLVLPKLDVILPVGISFYTFHTVTYIVDAYRRVIVPTKNFFEFSCYVSLFAQLVAGPIVRFRQIEADLERIDQADRAKHLDIGWSFFVIGLAKKVLIADTIAAVIDPAFSKYTELSSLDAWLCVLGYTYQLYFDFSGYSDMAVGLGHLFGLRLPQNFNSPYKALDIADFWRRWHMSLSTFLRDYLYIPLGGNRCATPRVFRNIMITMLLGGLWHGANWTFIIWGCYHGVLLLLYRMTQRWWDPLPAPVRGALTFVIVVIGWVIFRSTDLAMAETLLRAMFSWQAGGGMIGANVLMGMLCVAAPLAHLGPNTFELRHQWSSMTAVGMALLFGLSVFVIYGARSTPFLYFQF